MPIGDGRPWWQESLPGIDCHRPVEHEVHASPAPAPPGVDAKQFREFLLTRGITLWGRFFAIDDKGGADAAAKWFARELEMFEEWRRDNA